MLRTLIASRRNAGATKAEDGPSWTAGSAGLDVPAPLAKSVTLTTSPFCAETATTTAAPPSETPTTTTTTTPTATLLDSQEE
jgi:hypothetical protein